jgi:predicted Rdx family selenoprotein
MHQHDFQIINEDNDGILEICVECKKKVLNRKDKNGRVNNKKYLKEHIRDTAQPNGRTAKIFNKYYKK